MKPIVISEENDAFISIANYLFTEWQKYYRGSVKDGIYHSNTLPLNEWIHLYGIEQNISMWSYARPSDRTSTNIKQWVIEFTSEDDLIKMIMLASVIT